jgi:Na+/proline symporter
MGAVFLIGVLWRGATATAAYATLILGSIVSLSVGLMHFKHWVLAAIMLTIYITLN